MGDANATIAPVIGVELGAAQVAVSVLRGRQLGDPVTEPTRVDDTDALVDQIAALVRRARPEGVAGIGVCVPRIVDFETGRVIPVTRTIFDPADIALDLPLAHAALRPLLSERVDTPVFVDNGGNVAALAEAHDERFELAVRHLVMFTVGSGVDGGLILDGRIHRGASGAGGELGQTLLGLDLAGAVPAPMGFPQPGSLDFAASGHALDRLADVAGRVHPESALARLRRADKPILGDDVIDAARSGDESARRMIEVWGQRLGVAVANAIHTFDPEEVVIGGDAAHAGDLLLDPARRIAHAYVLPGLGRHTTIRLARHGDRSRLLGAALLARAGTADTAT